MSKVHARGGSCPAGGGAIRFRCDATAIPDFQPTSSGVGDPRGSCIWHSWVQYPFIR